MAVVAGCLLLAVACGDDDSDGASGGGAWSSGESFSVLGALAQVPADGIDRWVEVADVTRASELAGLDRPDADASPDELTAWLVDLTNAGVDGAPIFVPYQQEFGTASADVLLTEFADELGWSIFDVDAFVAAGNPPDRFVVVSGASLGEDTLASLPEVEPGVVTAGDGEDRVADLANRTIARPLGSPLRMAADGDRIAMSVSTPVVAAWLDDGSTLADIEPMADVALVLDDADAVTAVVIGTGELGIDDSSLVLGLGWSVVDGEAVVTVVYWFADQVDGRADRIGDEWAEREVGGRPLSAQVEVRDVASDENTVVVTLGLLDVAPGLPYQMLITRDLPFGPGDGMLAALEAGLTSD